MSYTPTRIIFDDLQDAQQLSPYYQVVLIPLTDIQQKPYIMPTGYYRSLRGGAMSDLLQRQDVQAGLAGAGGALLGGLFTKGSPWGGAIGGAAGPVIYSLLTPQQENWRDVLLQAGVGALGGGVGSSLGGPLGAAVGGGLGSWGGGALGQKLFNQQ